MKYILIHLKRNKKSSLLIFLLFFLVASLLSFSLTILLSGQEIQSAMESQLGTDLVIATPIVPFVGDYQSEQQIRDEISALQDMIAQLRKDPRVREVIVESRWNDGYLTTFVGSNRKELHGFYFPTFLEKGRSDTVELSGNSIVPTDEQGRFLQQAKSMPGIIEGKEARHLTEKDPSLFQLEAVTLGLKHEDVSIAFDEQPDLYPPEMAENTTIRTNKGVLPTLIGVSGEPVSVVEKERASVVAGRALSEEDNEKHANVIVMPLNSFYLNAEGKRPIQVGDTVPISINDFGKLTPVLELTVVGLHNGSKGLPYAYADQVISESITNWCFVPETTLQAIVERVSNWKGREQKTDVEKISVAGSVIPNLDPTAGYQNFTFPIIRARSFRDLEGIATRIQNTIAPLNALHENQPYQIQSNMDDYKLLAGSIEASKTMFTLLAGISAAATIALSLFLFIMQRARRSREKAILQSLGAMPSRLKFYFMVENGLIYLAAGFCGLIVAILGTTGLQTEWKAVHAEDVKTILGEGNANAVLSAFPMQGILLFIGLWILLFALAIAVAFFLYRHQSVTEQLRES